MHQECANVRGELWYLYHIILISVFCLTFLNDVTLDPSLTGGEEFSSPVNCVTWIEPKFGVVLSRLAGAISRRRSKLVKPGQFPIRIHQAIPCYQISQSQSLIFCDCQCTSASWVTRIILDFWCLKRPFLLQQYLCSPDRSTLGLGHIALRDLHSCATQNQIHLKTQLECWKRSMEETWTCFTVCQCLITLSFVAQVNM